MKRFRSPIRLLLCLALFASMFSGFVASAAPIKSPAVPCRGKEANLTVASIPTEKSLDCCILLEKPASKSFTAPSPAATDPCCEVLSKLPLRGKTLIGASPVVVDPCAPIVDGSCGITYPAGSVVGQIPFDQQAYYAPGLLADGVTINAGTYWVTGLGEAENGDGYYQIVVACQFLFVPENDVIPSYQAPWSGQPLPTTPPVES